MFDCEGDEIEVETGEEDISSDEEDKTPQATSQAATNNSSASTSALSIPKLAQSCPDDKTELLNDAKFIDEMGQLFLASTTSIRISSSVRGIQKYYIEARRNVKERIRLANSAKEKTPVEDANAGDNNGEANEIIDIY